MCELLACLSKNLIIEVGTARRNSLVPQSVAVRGHPPPPIFIDKLTKNVSIKSGQYADGLNTHLNLNFDLNYTFRMTVELSAKRVLYLEERPPEDAKRLEI